MGHVLVAYHVERVHACNAVVYVIATTAFATLVFHAVYEIGFVDK